MASKERLQLVRTRTYQQRRLAGDSSNASVVTLDNDDDLTYLATVTVDSNEYALIMDTGSTDLWISCSYFRGAKCLDMSTMSENDSCPNKATGIRYTAGLVCVDPKRVTLELGHLELDDHLIGIASGENVEKNSKNSLLAPGVDGLFGLSYDAMAKLPSSEGHTVIDRVKSFSMYLNAYEDEKSTNSFLMFNDVDEDLIDELAFTPHRVPLAEDFRWSLGMTQLKVGNETIQQPCTKNTLESTGCRAVIDTGTSMIRVPPPIFNLMDKMFFEGCTYGNGQKNGYPLCPRSMDLPTIGFTMAGTTFTLDPEDYAVDSGDDYVRLMFKPSYKGNEDEEHWTIGTPFMRKFYMDFQVDDSIVIYCNDDDNATVGACTNNAGISSSSGSGSLYDIDSSDEDSGSGNSSGSASQSGATGNDDGGSNDTVYIVVGVIVGVAAIILLAFGIRWFLRRRREKKENTEIYYMNSIPAEPSYERV